MHVAARPQVSAASAILTLGSGPAATTGDILIVNLGLRTLSAWVKCDSWRPDFLAESEARAEQWIHLGWIPSRAPFNCDSFRQRLDPDCVQPILELAFLPLEAQLPGSETPDLTAVIPYDAERNYQVLLGNTVVITARRPGRGSGVPRQTPSSPTGSP